eukprot:m.404460 g.404460  ORF g.404460 m.404460 type:complete len:311 (+) comp56475_c0_seq27:50-982(+)
MVVDGLHLALLYTRTRRWQAAVDVCSDILSKNPFDQAAWLLKVRALTELSCVDDTELEEEGLAELLLDENATAKVPRPGTSFKKPLTSSGASQGVRPLSKSGRPITGFARPGTQSARPSTVEGAIRTPRTALATARPVTTASGRFVRLGTASMASGVSDVFIDTSKLDLRKYAGRPSLCKALFRYLLHVANDTLKALELAAIATEQSQFQEWWWKSMSLPLVRPFVHLSERFVDSSSQSGYLLLSAGHVPRCREAVPVVSSFAAHDCHNPPSLKGLHSTGSAAECHSMLHRGAREIPHGDSVHGRNCSCL